MARTSSTWQSIFPMQSLWGLMDQRIRIARGREMATHAGATNVHLEAMDITQIQDQFGTFDYIICHGVFSWVPETVREHILRIYREQMNPLGIGYISYNAYPAWKQHEMLRDMMRFHAFRMDDPEEQILQARALVQFLGEHIPDAVNNAYGQFVGSQVEFISKLTEEYLYHEYLEAYNQPYWFYEFIKLLDNNALQYLGDTDLSSMINLHWSDDTRDLLNHISPTQYELEQYMDMLRCRRFRCTLFVHHAREVSRQIEPKLFKDFYFSYKACDKWSTPESEDGAEEEITDMTSEDIIATLPEYAEDNDTQSAIQVALFQHLHDMWPKRVHFTELIEIASSIKEEALDEIEILSLADLLQTLYLKEIVHIHLYSPSGTNDIPTHPQLNGVSSISSYLSRGHQHSVTRYGCRKGRMGRAMVILMDGTRTLDEIAEELYTKMTAEDASPLECTNDEGEEIVGKDGIIDVLQTRLLEILASFWRMAHLCRHHSALTKDTQQPFSEQWEVRNVVVPCFFHRM